MSKPPTGHLLKFDVNMSNNLQPVQGGAGTYKMSKYRAFLPSTAQVNTFKDPERAEGAVGTYKIWSAYGAVIAIAIARG